VDATPEDPVPFSIEGDGTQTRSFIYINDMVDGIMTIENSGEHLNVYHVGTDGEVSIAKVAGMVGDFYGRNVEIVAGPPVEGGTPRRCPDISKLAALGFVPKVRLEDGLSILARWYDENASQRPDEQTK
jgi:dTDP-glucose 4,6-dehydratase/UDP-glucose 4-epimerase